ncbi:MAG: hypothetical protein IJB91_01410 [Oscillospiraceae bacterium]|nr:hypothetical protein [Oscillospiraceae bacterium]
MKQLYLDIMELSLGAYTPERIREYIAEVRRDGLTEHGFPRLGANIGILMAHGRRLALKAEFIEIIDLCLYGFAHPQNKSKGGNNFAVREVCCAIMELEKTDVIDREQLEAWKEKLKALDISTTYTHIVSEDVKHPNNWAYFGVLSEQARGLLCGIPTDAFLEHQLPSQLLRLDKNGMYRDGSVTGPHQPMVYDMATRNLIGLSLFMGYDGMYAEKIEKMMDDSDDLTLKMQSVTGELAFGGRSNQCIHNEVMSANYYELRATLLSRKGEQEKAGLFKAAAKKAAETCMHWLQEKPVSHVKNHFDPDLQLGCEGYSYFNKYMITVASNAYLAYFVADDSIKPTVAPADMGGFVAETGEDFHKVFVNAGGYFAEIDCNADTSYDACGLGRVHKENCDPRVCLSVPFPSGKTNYKLETPNRHPLSICCYKNISDRIICSAESGVKHVLISKNECDSQCTVTLDCVLNEERLFTEKYTVSNAGVDIVFSGADGILLPAFLFDGVKETEILATNGQILVRYNGSFCKYTFSGEPEEYGLFFNRNGRYRAYKISANKLHIEIGDSNEL